jgi:DNA-binding CsgD family transcriptional regulator
MSEVDQRSLKALGSLQLTPREAEVLFWVSEGKSNQDIGVILGASTGTICKHVEHILSKLNVENRTAAAAVALQTCWSPVQQAKRRLGRPPAALAMFVAQQLSEIWSDGCEIYDAIMPLIA